MQRTKLSIYTAGGNRPGDRASYRRLVSFVEDKINYVPLTKRVTAMKTNKTLELFLDSGAFSAYSTGVPIDINEYIAFIKAHQEFIDVYANLDVIGDAKASLKNQRIMEAAGLKPLPCYHYNSPTKYLEYYLDRYDYIALGGMVPISTRDLYPWLDKIFTNHICDENGMPRVKVHGFGLTGFRLMRRYPWYSVDSTSWIIAGRIGGILVPRFKDGEYIYDEDPWKVNVSIKSPTTKEAGKHLSNFTENRREIILQYVHQKGLEIGESEIKQAPSKDYKLKEGEKWFGRKEDGEIEIIIKEGISNCYWLRDQLNIIYYLDFEKSLPDWPWPFKAKSKTLGVEEKW